MDKVKGPVVSGQRGVDVATHISSYFSSISVACHRVGAPLSVSESSFREIYSRFKYPHSDLTGCNRIRGPLAPVRQNLEAGLINKSLQQDYSLVIKLW